MNLLMICFGEYTNCENAGTSKIPSDNFHASIVSSSQSHHTVLRLVLEGDDVRLWDLLDRIARIVLVVVLDDNLDEMQKGRGLRNGDRHIHGRLRNLRC